MSTKDLGTRGNNEVIFRNATMDFLADWLLGYAQQGGLAPGALLQAFRRIRNGNPASWVRVFSDLAQLFEAEPSAAADWQSVQVAHRATLFMLDPRTQAARDATAGMERAFRRFLDSAAIELEQRPIPFRNHLLPAYSTPNLETATRLVVIIGGGDTYVEDLWFFGGRALIEGGWPILMVDLPGQGSTPDQGLHFSFDTMDALRAVFDELHARGFVGDVVLLGWSGGGIFTTRYAATARPKDRVVALVASAPVIDVHAMFERALPGVLRRKPNSRLMRALSAVARRNPVLDASLTKYDWQFGPGGLLGALDALGDQGITDTTTLKVAVLALVGAGESVELARQAQAAVAAVRPNHPTSRVITFPGWTGAAAHCQIGNIPLAMREVLTWLAQTLPAQTRMNPVAGR